MAAAAVSALQLWGHSFHSVTVKRRENILKLTDPRFEALLQKQIVLNQKRVALSLAVHF
jgi:hypothetical protein